MYIIIYVIIMSAEYRIVAYLFGVGLSTACEVVHETCQAIDHLLPKYIHFPSVDQ